jgi:hypothetical protein
VSVQSERHSKLTPVFYDWELNLEHAITQQALAYWKECRGERSMPAFEDLKLSGMKAFVANSSLIDMVSSGDGALDYSIKLTGEKVRERYGAVARSKLSEFLPPHLEQRWRDALELVRTAKAPLRVHGRMTYEDHTWLYQETLLAPLRESEDAVRLFLTVTAWWSVHDDGPVPHSSHR